MLLLLTMIFGASIAHAKDADGTYMVPAGDELEAPAVFAARKAEVEIQENGEARLVYRLPPELDGPEGQAFHLEGDIVDGRGVLTDGEGAVATCVEAGRDSVCTVKYESIVLDEAAAAAYVGTGPRAAVAKAARATLERQPIGVVRARRKS